MRLYSSCIVIPHGATCTEAMHDVDCKKVLRDGHYTVMLNGLHLRCSLKKIRDVNGMAWAADTFHICYVDWSDEKFISPAQAIELSRTTGIYTAIVQSRVTFADVIQSLLTYLRASDE